MTCRDLDGVVEERDTQVCVEEVCRRDCLECALALAHSCKAFSTRVWLLFLCPTALNERTLVDLGLRKSATVWPSEARVAGVSTLNHADSLGHNVGQQNGSKRVSIEDMVSTPRYVLAIVRFPAHCIPFLVYGVYCHEATDLQGQRVCQNSLERSEASLRLVEVGMHLSVSDREASQGSIIWANRTALRCYLGNSVVAK